MKMLPGMGGAAESMADMDPDQDLKRIEGLIDSMTPDERQNPDKIGISRRRRIANGSGVEPSEVNSLLKDFDRMSGMMQKMAGMSMRQRMRAVHEMGESGVLDGSAQLRKEKQRSKRGPTDRQT